MSTSAFTIEYCAAPRCANVARPGRAMCHVHSGPRIEQPQPAPCEACRTLAAENQRLRDAIERFGDDLIRINEHYRRLKATV